MTSYQLSHVKKKFKKKKKKKVVEEQFGGPVLVVQVLVQKVQHNEFL